MRTGDGLTRQNNNSVVEIGEDDDDSHKIPKVVEMLNLIEIF